MNRKEVLQILDAQREEIRKRFHAEVKGLVGSFARGSAAPGSDIDILVDFHPGATLIDYVGLAQYLEEKCGRRIDIVPEKDLRSELRRSMLADAVYL